MAGNGHWVSRTVLVGAVMAYSFQNFLLMIFSAVAWAKAKARVEDTPHFCGIGEIQCGFTRWGIYLAVSCAATIAFFTTMVMAVRSHTRAKGSVVDPMFVFRGIFFTLLVLASVVYIGWQDLNTMPNVIPDFNTLLQHSAATADISGCTNCSRGIYESNVDSYKYTYHGLGGGFLLEMADTGFTATKPAFVLLHLNL